MNVLAWHVHGSWTTAFVHGAHRYVIPVVPDRGPAGRGRAQTWDWPDSAVERSPAQLLEEPIDIVILQSPDDEIRTREWTGRVPGHDVPAIWLEHNCPRGDVTEMRHPAADRDDVVVVHVTHTNDLFWDCGTTRTRVIEHGIIDPGPLYTGALDRAAVVINEPLRRGRVVGADLLPRLARAVDIDLFGTGAGAMVASLPGPGADVRAYDDLPQQRLHAALAARRVYLHTARWTSLGLSLVEAMTIGMPIVALATTEVPAAIPEEAGVISNDLDAVADALRRFVEDADLARWTGAAARDAALSRFGLKRFLRDWDELMDEVCA